MDNLKYYNDSLAYDFNLFAPKEKEQKYADNIIKMPDKVKKQRSKAKAKSLSVSAVSVIMAAFMVAAVCGNIFLRVCITETSSKINDINKEISQLDAEITKLNVKFENIISYTNLENAAAEIGMKKMDKSQVVYMRVNNANAAITSSGEKVFSE